MEKINLLGIGFSRAPYDAFVETITAKAAVAESNYACVANVHMLVEAHKSHAFAQTVNNAPVVTPDGQPIVWALRLLHGVRQQRVDGMGLLPKLLLQAEASKIPVFFYGGSEDVLNKTAVHLKANYPSLPVAGMHSPPFRPLTDEEEKTVIEKINSSGAKLVFVALGCPKQEHWMASMKGRINAFMIGIGAALPVLIGEQKRAPQWMQRSGLEWLYRLGQEPRRLFKRYAVTNTIFIFLFLKAFLQQKLSGRKRIDLPEALQGN